MFLVALFYSGGDEEKEEAVNLVLDVLELSQMHDKHKVRLAFLHATKEMYRPVIRVRPHCDHRLLKQVFIVLDFYLVLLTVWKQCVRYVEFRHQMRSS